MTTITQAHEHRFPSGLDQAIIELTVPLNEIASRHNMKPEKWNEQAFGPANGMFVRLPSRQVVLLRELEHAIEHLGARGSTVLADVGDVVEVGVGRLIADVLMGLNITQDKVRWSAGRETERSAVAALSVLRAQQG